MRPFGPAVPRSTHQGVCRLGPCYGGKRSVRRPPSRNHLLAGQLRSQRDAPSGLGETRKADRIGEDISPSAYTELHTYTHTHTHTYTHAPTHTYKKMHTLSKTDMRAHRDTQIQTDAQTYT